MIRKITTLTSTLLIILVLIGSLFSSNIRSNLTALFSTLISNGLIGIVIIISLIWVFRSFSSDIKKLFIAKGNLKKFWDAI
jgi:uncharacterized protein YqhQ